MDGAVYRMVQGCYTPAGLVLSVVEMPVEVLMSTRSSFVGLVGMALHKVSKATEDNANARTKPASGALGLVILHWMMSGLWGCYLKPNRGDGWALDTGWK